MKDITWQSRYSDTNQPDSNGRWARIMYYKGLQFAWIKMISTEQGNKFVPYDKFPTSTDGLHPPLPVNTFEEAKSAVEERLRGFLEHILGEDKHKQP